MMKKITLFILMIIPFIGFSQGPWDFSNSDDGWNVNSNLSIATGSTFLALTTTGKNPALQNAGAGAITGDGSIAAITLRNNSANGPTFLRLSYPKQVSGRQYPAIDITNGDSNFKTYYIDVSTADWTGTIDDLKLHFKNTGNTDYTGDGTQTIDIDKIEFLTSIPKTNVHLFLFDSDNDLEGWTENNSTLTVSGGVATVVPNAGSSAKIVQNTYAVDASTNGFMFIKYKNLSAANNQFRIQFEETPSTGFKGTNVSISQSMSEFEVVTIDLATVKTEWTGITQSMQIIIRDTNNSNNASTGDMIIDGIAYSDTSTIPGSLTLGVDDVDYKEDASISLYPNPVNDVLNINSPLAIEKVEVYNMLGQKSLSSTSNNIDASSLVKGVYIVKIFQENNVISTKKIIKQ